MNHFVRILLICVFSLFFIKASLGQTIATNTNERTNNVTNTKDNKSELTEIIELLREQQRELERLRTKVDEQTKTIEDLRQRVDKSEAALIKTALPPTSSSTIVDGTTAGQTNSSTQNTQDTRLSRVEEQTKKTADAISRQLGSIRFIGDFRVRYESFYGQVNNSANANNPATLGNELSTRQRFRIRARFGMRGQVNDTIEWGLRFTTGSFADVVSTNQTLTDFFNRKPFALDQVYVAWTPKLADKNKTLRFQAGKFDAPWQRTEMTLDNDVMVEGFSQSVGFNFKNKPIESLTFTLWQLPLFERNSAFIRNANGTVNVAETKRGGRDLALYGGQVQAKFKIGKDAFLTLFAADHYFSGTQFISPVQVFGSNLLVPVTITIPATATTPSQTVTTQVSIPRDFFVAGSNLGLSVATNNATNRDGRLSSGYNLVDLIGRLDLWSKGKIPVTLIFDYVRNTQTHDVIIAGANNTNVFLPNNENSGYWARVQIGKTQKRGDWQLDYIFTRIEKDAVLTPFNGSDLGVQSDSRINRLTFNYTLDPKVIFSITGIFAQRPNGLNGVFGNTPAGSLNRTGTRLQFDTIFRF